MWRKHIFVSAFALYFNDFSNSSFGMTNSLLGELDGLGTEGLCFGGLQAIQIPPHNTISSAIFSCTPCVICTP
ncbi:Potassium-transporting ATPase alpha chain [Dirofilaria immitis]